MFGYYQFGEPYFADAPAQFTTPPTPEPEPEVLACPRRDCSDRPDSQLYSLQAGQLFNQTQLSYLTECPAGRYCHPGVLPAVISYPIGHFVMPMPVQVNSGFPIVLSMAGCEQQSTIILAPEATATEINAAAQTIFRELGRQQAICDTLEILDGEA